MTNFPRDFNQPPSTETNVKRHIQSNFSEWFSTGMKEDNQTVECSPAYTSQCLRFLLGYYVAAGISIQIDVLEQVGATGWSARIGYHSDDLEVCLLTRIAFIAQ
ncbi:unnamed protein product [Rotaria sp. Silwood1]|nr:unnamed protein product [Rotaria sp. Silwood1]